MYKREPVKGYEEYEIDTNGVVYSRNGKPLKYSLNHNGYCVINFSYDGYPKGFAIHRLVALQFIDNPDPEYKTQVNHIDGNKENNMVDNLEWVSPSENVRHSIDTLGYHLGKNNGNARGIVGVDCRGREIYSFPSIMDAAKYFTTDGKNPRYKQTAIWNALNGNKKQYRALSWYYT